MVASLIPAYIGLSETSRSCSSDGTRRANGIRIPSGISRCGATPDRRARQPTGRPRGPAVLARPGGRVRAVAEADPFIGALRACHDRLVAAVGALDQRSLTRPSGCAE